MWGAKDTSDTCHLNVVDPQHQLVAKALGQIGVLEAVHGETAAGVGITHLHRQITN